MSRTAARRRDAVADWLRAYGIVPRGAAKDAADAGVVDLLLLSRLNDADGFTVKRLPDGGRLPASLVAGEFMGGEFDGEVVAAPMRDPLTGFWIVTVSRQRRADGDLDLGGREHVDLFLHPSEPVTVVRPKRKAPPHVAAASAEYQDARRAWEARRDEWSLGYETEAREYESRMAQAGRPDPAPRFADFLREQHARAAEPESLTADEDAA